MEDSNKRLGSSTPPAEKTLETLAGLSYRAGELQDYLDQTCEALIELLGEGFVAVTLYRDGKKNILAQVPTPKNPLPPVDIHGPISTHVVQTGELLCVANTDLESRYGSPPKGYHSYIGVPLRLPKGDVVGTICYFDRATRNYRENEVQAVQLFSERVAIALDNYDLYQDLKQHSTKLEELVTDRTNQLLAARDELAHKEKLAAIGKFAACLTHEIRNPLTTIRLALEHIQRQADIDDDEASGKTRNIGNRKRAVLAANEVERLERMLNEVLIYTKPAKATIAALELDGFCADFIVTHESLAEAQGLALKLNIKSSAIVMADSDKLTQIFLNLTRNACDAALEGQVINVTTGVEGGHGFISMHNSGAIIPADKLSIITEAFVSGKANSSGLGLAIVNSLVDAQKGHMKIRSNTEDGTTFTIYLPLSHQADTE